MAGDVSGRRAIVWSRTDRPARMVVEWSTRESFADPSRIVGPAALPETGFTARVDLDGLPGGQTIFYRVTFQDLGDLRSWSLPAPGRFRSAPDAGQATRGVRIAWGADTVGQGFGIDASRGGMRTYETMRRLEPDVFVHTGDTIYADNPLVAEVPLDDGTVWRNLVTPAKSKVAETLEEFRGNHLYNLLDANVRRLVDGATGLGLAVLGGAVPIVSVLVGEEQATLQAGRFLFDAGYYVQSVVFPAVPHGAGVLRIQVNANHPSEAIDGLLAALSDLKQSAALPGPDEALVRLPEPAQGLRSSWPTRRRGSPRPTRGAAGEQPVPRSILAVSDRPAKACAPER